MLGKIIKFFLDNSIVSWLLLSLFIIWGFITVPFDYKMDWLPKDPVAVDAIPDIGENQQIIFTKWNGRSPQDVEDQITYPLTTSLLNIPGVKSVRSNSMFGFSSIYLIFEEEKPFYWCRSRILEKINSLPPNLLPENTQPTLGPDATALGQIFWYTLEGRDENGNPSGGWDLHELRSVQDFYVRYGLSSAEGVSEIASIGGYVKEYQVDVNPEKMRIYDITLNQVIKSIKESNLDIGAQTLEINLAEYYVRGLGNVKSIEDIEESSIRVKDNISVRIKDIAKVNIGPALRRGVLDKSGAEAVGGVVVSRFGENPMKVIQNVKNKIGEISPGLPSKTLADGTISKITIIPFYDRSELINETLGTLEETLSFEILITIIVIILMLMNFKSSLLISGSLPVAVLMCFIAMRYFNIDANIVALSGIAIAIGTMVDMGIVLTENMVKHIKSAQPGKPLKSIIYNATMEVASAVLTAVATTIVSFLPVFALIASEGKLFRPLAYTKTFALISSIIVALFILPTLAHQLYGVKLKKKLRSFINLLLLIISIVLVFTNYKFLGIAGILISVIALVTSNSNLLNEDGNKGKIKIIRNIVYALIVIGLLVKLWMPLGVNHNYFFNFLFISAAIGFIIGGFYLLIKNYEFILRLILKFKIIFLAFVGSLIILGGIIFKQIGQEFMPALDEGSFLYMPSSMQHSGMEVNMMNLKIMDMAVTAIPEIEMVVGKAGRVESILDPAPMSMYENLIRYKPEYKIDKKGRKLRFKVNEAGQFLKDEKGNLISDKNGKYYRQWREHIKSSDDIWTEIIHAVKIPGVTSAPKLYPIETRLIMLQTGMKSPIGIKVKGSDLKTIEQFGLKLEKYLKQVNGVKSSNVFADRIIAKPYLLIDIKRDKISRYGLSIASVQKQIQVAIGGISLTKTVEGRERYDIRIRYPRELRNDIEELKNIFISTPMKQYIKLGELVDIQYEKGPQAIKSEDGFLVGYVLFDKDEKVDETTVVKNAQAFIKEKIDNKELIVPTGISYKFVGEYEKQLRANKRLSIIIPISLIIIFLLLYFQFNSITTSLMVFFSVIIAFSGGFIMIWLFGQSWFMNFSFLGINFRELLHMQPINLSVAVWVGFLALFGIATDDGILIATLIKQNFRNKTIKSVAEIRNLVVLSGLKRVRPAMMTTATTILALLIIFTSTGKGSDIMLPMAIPIFGGMILQIITMFTVPVLYTMWKEKLFFKNNQNDINN